MTEWTEYHYHGFADHDDPTKYENQVRQTGRFTATVWALHLNVPTFLVKFVLTILGTGRDLGLTHEYSTGGSWVDWDLPAAHNGDNHLVVYFRSGAIAAHTIGRRLAEMAYGASSHGTYAISTAGDYTQLIRDTRKREVERAPTAEAERESGQQADD